MHLFKISRGPPRRLLHTFGRLTDALNYHFHWVTLPKAVLQRARPSQQSQRRFWVFIGGTDKNLLNDSQSCLVPLQQYTGIHGAL
jgi:hypothetical protein